MNVLAQNEKYLIWIEYETVYLTIEEKEKSIVIGDFYGDPNTAIIDKNGLFCAVGGCGIIIYYLKEPFYEYNYCVKSQQWSEYFRNGNYYAESINQVSLNSIKVRWENGEESIINIDL